MSSVKAELIPATGSGQCVAAPSGSTSEVEWAGVIDVPSHRGCTDDAGSDGTGSPSDGDVELGRGRSGIVYRSVDDTGHPYVRKVFGAAGATKLVQYVFLGAPNPYAWCAAAVRTAFLRRRILAELVEHWFGDKLRVARARAFAWNDAQKAYEIHCDLVAGRHVSLQHACQASRETELLDVTRAVMKPLQSRLVEAGFDGLVWQAGRGNPVALNNFMWEGNRDTGGWVWIDLESGVPALIPMNPVALLRFYLPKCVSYRRALFDDVDTAKLSAYVEARRDQLAETLGASRFQMLVSDVGALAHAQHEWKSLPRHERSIGYRLAGGSISQAEADWYAQHRTRWYAREVLRAARSVPLRVARLVTWCLFAVARIKFRHILRSFWRGIVSQSYRDRLARSYIISRIGRWCERGQISEAHASNLRGHVGDEESGRYLTDFGVHLAVKPIVKVLQFWVLPGMWMAGMIDDFMLGAFLVGGGSIVRTAYTLVRFAQNAVVGREKPWVALGVGALPVVGNLAFPLQIVFRGTAEHSAVAQFIVYDTFARLGRWCPIWGGADTLTEHFLNRVPNRLFRLRVLGSPSWSAETLLVPAGGRT